MPHAARRLHAWLIFDVGQNEIMSSWFALIPVTPIEWAVCLSIVGVGCLLFAIGNRMFGRKNEGGKRLVLLVAGLAFVLLGLFLCRGSRLAFEVQKYPEAIAFLLGFVTAAFGIYLSGASIFATGKALDNAFEYLKRSI